MIEDCDIWSLAVIFVVHSECVLLLDLGAQATVRHNLGSLVFDVVMAVDRVAALDTAGSQMDPRSLIDPSDSYFALGANRSRLTRLVKQHPAGGWALPI